MAEKDDWKAQETAAQDALNFWIDFLGMATDRNATPIPEGCKKCLLCIVRVISWVESRHGTGKGNQPARDPMQSGNKNDAWWKELTGNLPQGAKPGRVVGGKGKPNYNVPDVPAAVAKDANVPKGTTPLPADGHDNASFTPAMSYLWGILKLLQAMNKPVAKQGGGSTGGTYLLDDCKWKHLVDAAVEYNGGGDAGYRDKINAAAKDIKCCDEIDESDEKKEEKGE